MVMARKKKLNPIATALTIAAVGLTGWAIWTYIIKPRRNKLKSASMFDIIDSEPTPGEVLDAQFEIVDDQQA
jgi:hypothetical protein